MYTTVALDLTTSTNTRFVILAQIARVISCWRDNVVVIVCLRTSFEVNVVLKWAMITTLSRQPEMTRAIGAKNDESRSRTPTCSQI